MHGKLGTLQTFGRVSTVGKGGCCLDEPLSIHGVLSLSPGEPFLARFLQSILLLAIQTLRGVQRSALAQNCLCGSQCLLVERKQKRY